MGRPWVRAQGPTRHKAWVRVFAVLARQWTASPQPSASHPATFSQSYPQAKPSQRRLAGGRAQFHAVEVQARPGVVPVVLIGFLTGKPLPIGRRDGPPGVALRPADTTRNQGSAWAVSA